MRCKKHCEGSYCLCVHCQRVMSEDDRECTQEAPRGCVQPVVAGGCGDRLAEILHSILGKPSCPCVSCDEIRNAMNLWGVEKCRLNKAMIVEHLSKKYSEAEVMVKIMAGMRAISLGLPLTLEGMVDLAIRKAEESYKAAGNGAGSPLH